MKSLSPLAQPRDYVQEPFANIRHLILDRDGVLNQELAAGEYITDPKRFHWIPKSLQALAKLRKLGLRISVATNQSGIGRGLMTEADLQAVHEKMLSEAAAAQGSIDAVFYCPHAPNERCSCRKPARGLILAAIEQAGIDAENTLVIGDDERDLEAATSAGISAALVRTGKGLKNAALAAARGMPIFDDLDAFADTLLTHMAHQEKAPHMLSAMFAEHIAVVSDVAAHMLPLLNRCLSITEQALLRGNKILACGNGGSAADAQHFVAELVGRYKISRHPLPAVALAGDISSLTAISNDFGFDYVFSRQVDALARPGDVLLAISTSGNSKNVINAVEAARAHGCQIIALTGRSGGQLAQHADITLQVPSDNVARIQEVHGLCLHALAEMMDTIDVRATLP